MKKKRSSKEPEAFGLSFLDCICCGFGAVLLIFVLTAGKKANILKDQEDSIQQIITRLASEIEQEKEKSETLEKSLQENGTLITQATSKNKTLENQIISQTDSLNALLEKNLTLEDALAQLIAEQAALPTQDTTTPLPIPNPQRRQYLTQFKLEGQRTLILFEASGGMLASTIEEAASMLALPPEQQRQAAKWQRTLNMIRWFIATLNPGTQYQVCAFNKDIVPLLPTQAPLGSWIDPTDTDKTAQLLDNLKALTPQGGANLERAFTAIDVLETPPDNIILIADGLPTLSDSIASDGYVDEQTRFKMFEVAVRAISPKIPINTLILPMSGDPAAATAFWILASRNQGALVSPAPSWPDL